MASSSESNSSIWYSNDVSFTISPIVKFWIFLVLDVCAILCTIFVLYHLLSKRQLRIAPHNHIPIILLVLAFIYECIDIPFHLEFFLTGRIHLETPMLCLIWWFIDWGFYFIIAVLLVFASLERHVLIFHSQLYTSRRKRFLFHYLPILGILFFMTMFYSIVIFAPICTSTFDYTADLCGTHACYGSIPFLSAIEQLLFGEISIFLIVIFSMTLLIRVVRQKHRVHGVIQWKKQRKIALQMFSLSSLYTTFSLPITTIYVVRLFGPPDWGEQVLSIFFFLSYFAIFLLPYVCLMNLPDLSRIFRNFTLRARTQVGIHLPPP